MLDEFDRVSSEQFRYRIAELLKNLSDRAARVQLIIGGVAVNLVELIERVPSSQRNIFALRIPRMTEAEVRELVENGEGVAGLKFSPPAVDMVCIMSCGLPYLANLICHHAGVAALSDNKTEVAPNEVSVAVDLALEEIKGHLSRRAVRDHVPAGQWGCQIVFMKPVSKAVKDDRTGEERQDRFTVMRTFTVFNVDQVDGEKLDSFRVEQATDTSVIDPDFAPADRLVEALGIDVREGGNIACYNRPMPEGSWPHHTSGDFIQVPGRRQYPNQANYWETVFHEVAHLAEVRLGWDHRKEGYAMGELVAEISACMVVTELGLPQGEDVENHAAYLKSWLGAMRADPGFIFRASTQASRVTDYLLGFIGADRQPVLVDG